MHSITSSSSHLISQLSPIPSTPALTLPFLPSPCPQLGHAHSCLRSRLTRLNLLPSSCLSLKSWLKSDIFLPGTHSHVLCGFSHTVFLKGRGTTVK